MTVDSRVRQKHKNNDIFECQWDYMENRGKILPNIDIKKG